MYLTKTVVTHLLIVTFYDYDYVNTKRKCQDATIIEIFTLIFFKSFVVHSVCWWWLM